MSGPRLSPIADVKFGPPLPASSSGSTGREQSITRILAEGFKAGKVRFKVNPFLEGSPNAILDQLFPGRHSRTPETVWISRALPGNKDLLERVAGWVWITPLGPAPFTNQFWDGRGGFRGCLYSGRFAEFTGDPADHIIEMKVTEEVFARLASHLEPPSIAAH